MAALCHFYGWAPDVVWNMTTSDISGFISWRNEYIKSQNRG